MIKYLDRRWNSDKVRESSFKSFFYSSKCYSLNRSDGFALQRQRNNALGISSHGINLFFPYEKKKNNQSIKRKQTFCYYNNLIVEDYHKFAKQMQDRLAINFHLPVANDII